LEVLSSRHQVLHRILLCAPPDECCQSPKEEHHARGFQNPEDFPVRKLKPIRQSRRDEAQPNIQPLGRCPDNGGPMRAGAVKQSMEFVAVWIMSPEVLQMFFECEFSHPSIPSANVTPSLVPHRQSATAQLVQSFLERESTKAIVCQMRESLLKS
jgi:hypothetical protein